MIQKHLLRPDRLRRVPQGFNWIDHRLVGDNLIRRCDHAALALYLFLVTVADGQGLSYYSDASLGRWLSLDQTQLAVARQQLVRADLIAYQKPLYQVLALDPPARPPELARNSQAQSAGEILRQFLQAGGYQ